MTNEASLYERAGGADGIVHLVDAFYQRVLADPGLAPFFSHVPMDKLRRMQVELFTTALGGPGDYTGRPLGGVHQGRGITTGHLRAFVEHLFATLEALHLSRRDVQAIYERLALEADEVVSGGAGAGEAG